MDFSLTRKLVTCLRHSLLVIPSCSTFSLVTFLFDYRHGPGLVLVDFVWKTGSTVLATTEKATLTLPIGEHIVTLTVVDSDGNDSTEATMITVFDYGYPWISGLSPDNGPLGGGNDVTINGSGFTNVLDVKFGQNSVSGSAVEVVDENTITVQAPVVSSGVPVDVAVTTSLGVSNTATYTYVANSRIEFDEIDLLFFPVPTVVQFGPNGKLYVANTLGQIAAFIIDDDLNAVNPVISSVAPYRSILGLAFDPLDTKSNPDVFFSHSMFYHGEQKSSSGRAINGMVSKASGANLEFVVDIITGLPVSDGDHGTFLLGASCLDQYLLLLCSRCFFCFLLLVLCSCERSGIWRLRRTLHSNWRVRVFTLLLCIACTLTL